MDGASSTIITKVPGNLKKLVCLTARAFYQPMQIVCLDVLTKFSCVALADLVEVLQMHGCLKQLQQALNILQKDKLVKWVQKMEVPDTEIEGGATPKPKMIHYYYINYKLFVNVVKYKLDMMRKKVESEDRMAQNRMSYNCSRCNSTFNDLEVDRLFNTDTGGLRCLFCGNTVEEEQQENVVDSRTLLAQLNEFLKPITDLLRETENLNLAPELLDPEPQSISKYLLSSGVGRRVSTATREWNTRSATDIYGDSTAISVNIGDGNQQASKNEVKERPEWMARSTVYQSEDLTLPDLEPAIKPSKNFKRDSLDNSGQILQDLMVHEARPVVPSLESSIPSGSSIPSVGMPQYNNSSSSGEEDMAGDHQVPSASVSYVGVGGYDAEEVEEFKAESSEEEEYTVKVGDKMVPVDEITDEIVARMTKEEKERYTEVWQRAFSQTDDYG